MFFGPWLGKAKRSNKKAMASSNPIKVAISASSTPSATTAVAAVDPPASPAPAEPAVAPTSASQTADPDASCYAFSPPATPFAYPSLTGKDCASRWEKWGLAARTLTVRLSLSRGGRDPAAEAPAFLCDLFNSAALRGELAPLSPSGTPLQLTGAVSAVTATRLRTSATSLDFFDALVACGALGASGSGAAAGSGEAGVVWIRKRLEESWQGLPIVDCLREALVLPPEGDPEGVDPSGEAEALQQPNRYGTAFSEAQRAEFLFHVARWVVAGGAMCQHEDFWGPYEAAVRDVARDFLAVVKSGEGGEEGEGVRVVSQVWAVKGLQGEGLNGQLRGGGLWPLDSPHNVCLVVADPLHRVAHVLHSSFVPFW